jgi:hypothetical protein
VRYGHGVPEVIRLADNDSKRLALALMGPIMRRAYRDAHRLGLVLKPAGGQEPQDGSVVVVAGSEVYRAVEKLVEWAQAGRGNPAEIAACILQVRADLEGVDVLEAPTTRAPDPATLPGAVLVAAGARLAVVEGRTVTAVELAVLASVDEHTVRAAVKAGALRPVPGTHRPMRFEADVAAVYLYVRGVPGVVRPQGFASGT